MNMLSREAVMEYQKIYREKFGKDISSAEAEIQGARLLRLMKLIYKPTPMGVKTYENKVTSG